MSAQDWTEEREQKLRLLWTQGVSASAIAKELNKLPGNPLSRNAVIGKRLRMKMPNRTGDYGGVAAARKKRIEDAARRAPKLKAPPVLKPEPMPKPRAPLKDAGAIRFIDREPNQCPMFCQGEEGALGFICGKPVKRGETWCANCHKLIWAETRRVA